MDRKRDSDGEGESRCQFAPKFFANSGAYSKNLRRKLEAAGGDPELIETVYGVGYRLLEGE